MYLKLIEKKQEVEGVTSFIFEPETSVDWIPGQYAHYVLHHLPTDDRGSDRWFTVSAAPFEKNLRITTRLASDKSSSFKNKLFDLAVDKWIEISVIEGDFIIEDLKQEYILIAGGIGITPFRSILKQLDQDKKQINATLLYANRDEHIVFKEELEGFAKNNPNFKIRYIISPKHLDEKAIQENVTDLKKPIFYVSGPEPMVESIGEMLKKMGVSENHLKQDFFPNYPAE